MTLSFSTDHGRRDESIPKIETKSKIDYCIMLNSEHIGLNLHDMVCDTNSI